MLNILKTIDATDLAIRHAVFAVLDVLITERRSNRKERGRRMQERDKHQLREFIGGRP